jgi:SAM-dependent methyltransferase
MSYEKSVSDHYLHGELLKAIEVSLPLLGKTTSTVTIEDLAPVDEFHTGGQAATNHLLEQLDFLEHSHVLDVGCGLGGAARYVATKSDIHVTGIDLTAEYVETGKVLCRWLNLQDRVILKQGSALSMPFESRQFDGGYMLHVGMNIDDKQALFSEVARVLKPGAAFGVYDVMLLSEGEILYPVPWATDSGTSKLASPDEYKQALCNAGFTIASKNSRRDFALEFFKRIKSNNESSGGPPPLGLHTLMQQSTAQKIQNLMTNITSERLAPVEMIAIKN